VSQYVPLQSYNRASGDLLRLSVLSGRQGCNQACLVMTEYKSHYLTGPVLERTFSDSEEKETGLRARRAALQDRKSKAAA
jgi:hypothetical protein